MIQNPLISQKEWETLSECAKAVKYGSIVEIGNYCGASTLALAWGANDGTMIYSIDPHLPFSDPIPGDPKGINFGPHDKKALYYSLIVENMKASEWFNGFPFSRVSLIELSSNVVPADIFVPIGMVFIDGNHSLEQARKDYTNFALKMEKGGILAFHDKDWPGPTQVIRDAIDSDLFEPKIMVDNLAIMVKVK